MSAPVLPEARNPKPPVFEVSRSLPSGTQIVDSPLNKPPISMLQTKPDLEKEILQYLLNNPEGKDTIRGIARFWILGNKIERMVDDLQMALKDLVEQGYLNEKKIPASSGHPAEHCYELNSSRISEIVDLVKRRSS